MIPNNLGQHLSDNWWILVIVLAWSLVWKGLALWHAARRDHSVWFIVLLIVNTLGILELIYLLGIVKVQKRQKTGFSESANS